MKFLRRIALCLALAGSTCMAAEDLQIATDIPTTHSLVSLIVGDLGKVTLLVPATISPHDFSLRPSQTRQIQQADILIWTARELTPWLVKTATSLNPSVPSIELLRAEGTVQLSYRDDEHSFHSHTHEEAHGTIAGTSSKKDHGAGQTTTALQNKTASPTLDPHAWLDPVNATHWLGIITKQLSTLDSENRHIYESNYQTATLQLASQIQSIEEQLMDLRERDFVVFHDSYHYFENRFGLRSATPIRLGDAKSPSIKRLAGVQAKIKSMGEVCVFSEPQFSQKLIQSVTRGLPVAAGSLDPLGAAHPIGANLYFRTIGSLANELQRCLTGAVSH